MIRTITISGFKSIPRLTLELGRVNCFIGANGVGKSNILEAIGVLGAAANGIVDDESLLRRGVRPGVPRLYKTSFASEKTPVHIGLSAKGEAGPEYRISILNPIENPNPAWNFKTEYLSSGQQELVTSGIRSERSTESANTHGRAALQMADMLPENPAYQLLQTLRQYAIYCPNTATLRGMQPDPQTRTPLGLSGGRLAEAFADFKKHVLSEDDELADSVLGLIDWVADIETTQSAGTLLSPSVARTQHVLKLTDRFMNRSRNTLTAYDASEGALYILFSAILCLMPQAPQLFAIDNLDQALNPRLASRLAGMLASWLERTDQQRQLLFTTHNPAVLDGLDLLDDEVRLFAVDRNNHGHTCVRRIEMDDQLQAMNRDYPLSRLWLMGHLGAVPNV